MKRPDRRAVLDSFCGLGRIEATPISAPVSKSVPVGKTMKYELNQRARQLLERVAASTAEFPRPRD